MVESEYKCILDSTSYQDIVKKLDLASKGNRIVQINYYYDTEDFKLDRYDITFRIRQKDKKLSIEIKYPLENDGLLRVKNEVEYMVDRVPNFIDVSGSPKLSGYLDGTKKIKLMGALITERTSYQVKEGIKVDIDKSYYCGDIDYELEIEFEGDIRQETSALLEELTGGRYVVPQGGKRERFIYKLRQMQEYFLV